MDDREWMYSGRQSAREITREWVDKTEAFIKQVFDQVPGARAIFCPCINCKNRKRQTKEVMTSHLARHGFTKNYTQWTHHGEADRVREEVVRPRVEDYNADAGVAACTLDPHTTPTLSQVRTSSTSGSVPIRPRQDTSTHRVAALQARVEEER
ncbi:uncharacterized protein, partial [Miscanthus floridulus]|uniref:uncharacterized protein n=1 Tax=Miscanthus floridulus TaxID=154761 RepID=UPI00345A3791